MARATDRTLTGRRGALAGLALGVLAVPGVASVVADEAEGGALAPYPAGIHRGSCEAFAPDPAYALPDLDLDPDDDGDDDRARHRLAGNGAGSLVVRAAEAVPTTLDALLAEPHALVVGRAEDDGWRMVACGELAGYVLDDDEDDGRLAIGLRPMGGSGNSGVALLDDDGRAETDLRVYLTGDEVSDDGWVAATDGGIQVYRADDPLDDDTVFVAGTDDGTDDGTGGAPVGATGTDDDGAGGFAGDDDDGFAGDDGGTDDGTAGAPPAAPPAPPAAPVGDDDGSDDGASGGGGDDDDGGDDGDDDGGDD